MEMDCGKWYNISLEVYEKLLAKLEMQEANKEDQDCDQKSVQLRASMTLLPPYAHRTTMQENDIVVQRARELENRMLSNKSYLIRSHCCKMRLYK